MGRLRSLVRTGAVLCSGVTLLIPAVADAQECFPAPDGLAAWWAGDDNTDDIAGILDGDLENGATFGEGAVLRAFSFDGVDDRVLVSDIGNTLALASFTYDMWVFPTSVPPGRSMRAFSTFRQDGGANRGALVSIDPESHLVPGGSSTKLIPRFDIYTSGVELSVFDDTVEIPLNEWTHLAVSVDNATKQLTAYVDGVRLTFLKQWPALNPFSGTFPGIMQYPSPIRAYIGAEEQFTNDFVAHWIGSVDEVEVYDRALSAPEVLAIYDAGSAGKCKDEDGDGFRPPEDCDEMNADINPDAVELPGNFVDENCDGSLGDVDPCFDWNSHGEYIRNVAHAVNELLVAGILTDEEGDALISSAAVSKTGKKGFIPSECQ